MNERITIIKRTDIDKSRIHIKKRTTTFDGGESNIVESIRVHLLKRHTSFSVTLWSFETIKYGVSLKDLPSKLIALACTIKKPFVRNDYDYLQRSVRSISCRIMSTLAFAQLVYDIEYLTNSRQEEEIESFMNNLFFESKAYSITQPDRRIKFAYDYIVATVKYDNDYKMYSAYNALFDRKAVCEGCALLFYRFMAMFGIPCRIITGKGMRESHAWNIVKLGDFWYNIDVTWDLYKNPIQRGLGLYNYYLVGEEKFKDHTRDPFFETDDFKREFPVSQIDYC